MLVFDGKNGGAQCRWKMHYVGCTRNEADCPDKFRQEVPKVQGHRAVSKRSFIKFYIKFQYEMRCFKKILGCS